MPEEPAMTLPFRRLAAAGACIVATVLSVTAAPVPKIQYTDVRLANGLRVIASEDHSAPVFSFVVDILRKKGDVEVSDADGMPMK